jgi:hypothetical protein
MRLLLLLRLTEDLVRASDVLVFRGWIVAEVGIVTVLVGLVRRLFVEIVCDGLGLLDRLVRLWVCLGGWQMNVCWKGC